MSYNMPMILISIFLNCLIMSMMLSSKFHSHNIKIEDLKINPINPFNPNKTKGGVKIKNLLLGMSYNMPKVLCSDFQSHSIIIEDICLRE